MAALINCSNCGTATWFRTWREVGCPKCGLALTHPADGVPGYSATEMNDSDKVNQALRAMRSSDTKRARALLDEVIANSPSEYVNAYEEDNQHFIKCWDEHEFLSYLEAMKAGQVPSHNNVVWVRSVYPMAYHQLAFLEVEAGNYELAIAALTASLKLEPDQPLTLDELGVVYTNLKDSKKALEFFERALKARRYMSARIRAKCLRGKGVQLINLREIDLAEAALKDSLVYEPGNEVARKELAYIDRLRSGGKATGTTGIGRTPDPFGKNTPPENAPRVSPSNANVSPKKSWWKFWE